MSQNLTKEALSDNLLKELDKLDWTINITNFTCNEVKKPTIEHHITMVATDQEIQRFVDVNYTTSSFESINDSINAYCQERDIDINSIHVFPLYRLAGEWSVQNGSNVGKMTADRWYKSHGVVGFVYIDKAEVTKRFGYRNKHIQEGLLENFINMTVSQTIEWADNKIYRAIIKKDEQIIWDSGIIYHINSWDFYLDCVMKTLKVKTKTGELVLPAVSSTH